MAIHDRDYMKKPASPSEFPDSVETDEATKPKPFDLFAGVPVEEISTATISKLAAPKSKPEEKDSAPATASNYWLLAVIVLIVGIILCAIFSS